MSVQDKVERTLREMHVLFSKSEPYDKESGKVIVNKKEVIGLLNELKAVMSEMMEEYEITKESRDRGEREARKHGEDIIWDASHKAEDVYAASVIYSDEALSCIQEIIQSANDEMEQVFRNIKKEMKAKQQVVRENQLELKASLGDLRDTNKYLNIIDESNKERQRKKEAKEAKRAKQKEEPAFQVVKPKIKINQEYFQKMGIPLEETAVEETEEVHEITPEEKAAQEMQIKVNLDAEYFRWKNEQKKQG